MNSFRKRSCCRIDVLFCPSEKKHPHTPPPFHQRAEHNDGVLATATELALHQLHAIDVGPLARAAKRVTRLSLAGNALPRVPRLGAMKELTDLNLALNAIVRVTVRWCEGGEKVVLRKKKKPFTFPPTTHTSFPYRTWPASSR